MRPPSWLPFRVRAAWDLRRVRFALRRLDETSPVHVEPSGANGPELHMLVCKRDMQIAVLAVKSLMRYVASPLCITFTNDGSLSPHDRAWIDQHIVNARWLSRHACLDSPSLLGPYPRLLKLYQTGYHPLCKLLHPRVLSAAEKVIVLDPDTAFFKSPQRLLEWMEGSGSPALFLHDHQAEDEQVPAPTCAAFEEVRQQMCRTGRPWSMPYYFFNSGLLAYKREALDLQIAEEYLAWWEQAPVVYRTGKNGLWFGDWTPEQLCYQVMFATTDPPAEPLGEQYRIGRAAGYVFNHFLWLQLVEEFSLQRLSSLVDVIAARPGYVDTEKSIA